MIDTTRKLSKSILHDIIKSCINYYPHEIIEICKTIPSVKNSNILKETCWSFVESREEVPNVKQRQADVVWFYKDKDLNPFYIVHEIKTGAYDIDEIYKKYHTGMTVQIWIWSLHNFYPNPRPNIKVIPISYISGFVTEHVKESLFILNGELYE